MKLSLTMVQEKFMWCKVRDLQTREVLLAGSISDGLYKLHSSAPGSSMFPAQCLTASTMIPFDVWHCRLGHPCNATLKKTLYHCNVPFVTNKHTTCCTACHLGKEHKQPFSHSASEYTAPLQLVFADVWGPAPVASNGFRYYVAFTDAYSKYTWLYFLHKKSDVLSMFPVFHRQAERLLGCKLKILQTDGGGEFQTLNSYLLQHGIVRRVTCPYTSQQNGLVECKHKQIVEAGLSMMEYAGLPITYWNEAFCSAVFLVNKLPSSPLGVSPYEKLFCERPNYLFLRVFGCLCFPNLWLFNTSKLQFRSSPCTFLGYSPYHKGYQCQAADGRVYISRHVTFHENEFPFKKLFSKLTDSQPLVAFSSSKLLVLHSESNAAVSPVLCRNSAPMTSSVNSLLNGSLRVVSIQLRILP